ncbi:MAG: serine/threonine-protein kinase, partial [Verrucomicrobiota bacterium]
MKSSPSTCTRCGKELPADAPRELCPPCLLEAVMSAPDDFVDEVESDDTWLTPNQPEIPNYKIRQLLGSGGFGEVYSAEQTAPIRRAVALKVLKREMNSRQIMKRFDAERQALALMEHTNIATIYDAGETEDGRPFVSMELVKGPPVTTFCDREEWDIPQRLELLITICEAVQHAHQKGVIHRDLKPSNLLVARNESGEAVPTVIDFGIAKALDEPLTNQTVVTQIHQVMGTPAYMSPE